MNAYKICNLKFKTTICTNTVYTMCTYIHIVHQIVSHLKHSISIIVSILTRRPPTSSVHTLCVCRVVCTCHHVLLFAARIVSDGFVARWPPPVFYHNLIVFHFILVSILSLPLPAQLVSFTQITQFDRQTTGWIWLLNIRWNWILATFWLHVFFCLVLAMHSILLNIWKPLRSHCLVNRQIHLLRWRSLRHYRVISFLLKRCHSTAHD